MRKWTDKEIHDDQKMHHQFILYFNPKDARIIVPKYSGMGVTINFGHISTMLIGIAMIALIVASIVL